MIADLNTSWSLWALSGISNSRSAAGKYADYVGWCKRRAAELKCQSDDVERACSQAAHPISHTSGTVDIRLRPTKQRNRQLNKALHRIALTQINRGGPGKTYYQRRLAEGDSRQRALRSLKRRLVRVVYTRLRTDLTDQRLKVIGREGKR